MVLIPTKCVVVPIDLSQSSATIAAALEVVPQPADVGLLHVVLPSSHRTAFIESNG